MEIVAAVFTSGLVTSAILFLFQQSMSAKLKHVELQFSSVLQYRQKNLDLVIKAYDDVWGGLIEIERFLQFQLPEQLNTGSHMDFKNVYDAHYRFRQRMLLLPDDLCVTTEASVLRLQNRLNQFLAIVREQARRNPKPGPQELAVIQQEMQAVKDAFTEDMKGLRESFQSSLRLLVYG